MAYRPPRPVPSLAPPRKRARFGGSLARTLDYATAQLEAATDPAVTALWRQLAADLEFIASKHTETRP